jgi:hypothetical protein
MISFISYEKPQYNEQPVLTSFGRARKTPAVQPGPFAMKQANQEYPHLFVVQNPRPM